MDAASVRLVEELFKRYEGFQEQALRKIGKSIRQYGKLTPYQAKQLNNMARSRETLESIQRDLAKITGKNIADLNKIYGDAINAAHKAQIPIYDYRGIKYIPYEDNRYLQALARSYAKSTADTMVNLSKTRALGFTQRNGQFVRADRKLYDVFGRASLQVTTGSVDFHTAMRDAITEIGESGIRVSYEGINRRLDTVVRQNLLYTVKQCHEEYQRTIGEELGCDGIEVDWHSNPRPSHEFMQGRQFSKHGTITVNGVEYPGADEEQDPLTGVTVYEALDEYGCLHYTAEIICGVSEPRYDADELKRLNAENAREIDVDGEKKSGYEWKQSMRALETGIRNVKCELAIAEGAGDEELSERCRQRLSRYREKYNSISEATGIHKDSSRTGIIKPLLW